MNNPTLHVFNQYCNHDDVWLRGNREALKRLRDALDVVLQPGKDAGAVGMWANDGEGYNVYILAVDDEEKWKNAALPYRADWCAPSKDDTFPWTELDHETYMALREKAIEGLRWTPPKSASD